MLAIHRSGRQADALEAYRRARHVLIEDVGPDRSPELRRLEAAILSHDRALLADPHVRLLTLTGPGSIGNSHFALELAHRIALVRRRRARFVALAGPEGPALVATEMAQATAFGRLGMFAGGFMLEAPWPSAASRHSKRSPCWSSTAC